MKYPVSMIPYANVGPYRALGAPEGCEFIETNPKASSEALKKGRLLAAPVPVGMLPSLKEEVEYLGHYGIAANGEVESVLLFSDRPFEKLDAAACLSLTNHSASSVRLLFLLLGYQNGFDNLPVVTANDQTADAELLIGDQALLHTAETSRRFITDLASRWVKRMKTPFVFARWVIRRDAPRNFRAAMRNWLRRFEENIEGLTRQAAGIEAARLGMTRERMLAYLLRMKLVLGEEELRGQDLFLSELARHGRHPLFLPAERAGIYQR